jgi:hypothetical protein
MIRIQAPYGVKTLQVGNVHVYSIKLRVVADIDAVETAFSNEPVTVYAGKRNTVIVSGQTTNHAEFTNWQEIWRSIMLNTMISRAFAKYGEKKPAEFEPYVDLPF